MLESFEKENVAHISIVKAHREISLRIKNLPRGTYVIVPSTKSPGDVGKFIMSIYFDCTMRDIKRLQRLDKKESKFMIYEEEEGVEFDDWKYDLINKRLKFMMGGEDPALNEN